MDCDDQVGVVKRDRTSGRGNIETVRSHFERNPPAESKWGRGVAFRTWLLAMSIDGATHLADVSKDAWRQLARDVGLAPRFLAQRMEPFVVRVFDTAVELSGQPEHDDQMVETLVAGMASRLRRTS